MSGSVALLGDTLHNGVDVAGTAIVWAAFGVTSGAGRKVLDLDIIALRTSQAWRSLP